MRLNYRFETKMSGLKGIIKVTYVDSSLYFLHFLYSTTI